MARALLIAWLIFFAAQAAAIAQPAPGEWPLESISLADGRTLRGLLQSQHTHEIEFIEIRRTPGKPMSAILYPLLAKEVLSIERLEPAERKQLQERFLEFRNRAQIEAGRQEALVLKDHTRVERKWRVYEGEWFTLESTADEATTRRSIVRIEQMFRAYRLLLAPRESKHRPLRIVLYGSLDEYRTHLRSLGLDIANPAYYAIARNEIVTGSDLSQYAAELAKVNARSEALRKEYRELDRSLGARLKKLGEQMQTKGFNKQEIKDELQTRRNVWSAELKQLEAQLTDIGRRNDAKFATVTQEMFRRLSHEAFHAYVENYVFPQAKGELPHWLNEGLAQIFEHAQLEADSLRFDAPDKRLLARLQQDLSGKEPLPLASLLTADGRQFVKLHGSDATDRHYLYAWGLAWYLTFEFDLLRSDRMDALTKNDPDKPPVARFEQLTRQPLSTFEKNWREALLKMK